MTEDFERTIVCSVLFLDMVGYSKRSVEQQHKLKQGLNRVLAEALETIAPMDRIILDTGDGAAIAFTGDPDDALFVALQVRDNAGDIGVRLGINLGPVRLVRDLNGQINMIGDGINVANRVMHFCNPGDLLVSRAFYEVASCLSDNYVNLFTPAGSRLDKHEREHQVFAVDPQLHAAGTGANFVLQYVAADSGLANRGSRARDVPDQSARVFDAGESLIISGASRSCVESALNQLLASGAALIAPVAPVQNKWMATCGHPPGAGPAVEVAELGLTRIVTGRAREDVARKVEELLSLGAVLVHDLECTNGIWTAVCETR